MLSSVLAGVAALPGWASAAFILPVDTPLVRPCTIRQLGEAYLNTRASVVYPCFRGKRGHPPLVARKCFAEPVAANTEGGLATILARQPDALDLVVLDEGVLWDMDTPAEYARMAAWAERDGVPTEAECEAILEHCSVPPAVVAHSRVVAAVAANLAERVNGGAAALDVALVRAAGVLHDLAKGKSAHDKEGERLLRAIGYERLGGIVGQHVDVDFDPATSLREEHLLYLADKVVKGERVVPLAERFDAAVRRFGQDPEALRAIEARFRNAEAIAEKVQDVIGSPLADILGQEGAADAS